MSDKLKKAVKWCPSEKLTAGVFLFAVVLALIPLLRLCLYSAPYYDDYSYGMQVKSAVESGGGIWEIIKTAVANSKEFYYSWQGTFSSCFFMSLMPAAFGDQYYFIGPVILILMFVTGIFLFTMILSRGVLKADWYNSITVSCIAVLMQVLFLHSTQQAFYWYNAGVHYIGAYAFMLYYMSAMVALLFVKKEGKHPVRTTLLIVLSCIFAITIGGSNFVNCLQGLLIVCSMAGLAFLLFRWKAWPVLPALLVNVASFYLNVSANGNTVRKAYYAGMGYQPLEAVARSFLEAAVWIPKFTKFYTILVLALFVPVAVRIVKNTKFRFGHPIFLALWSVCLYAAGFTPQLYSTGSMDLARVLNVIKITYYFLLLINEIYLIGFFYQKRQQKNKEVSYQGNVRWWVYAVWAGLFLISFAATEDKIGSFSSYGAYYYVHSGEAYNYRQAYLERVETIKESPLEEVPVKPYIYKPWFLAKPNELTEDKNSEQNRFMAQYYGKTAVWVDPELE